jgi:tetratricopeptide (TPR) repeat protein
MDASDLFEKATAALKAKRNDEARRLLAEVVHLNANHEQAWLALASVLTDMHQAVDCLDRVLAINPTNATAKEWRAFAQQEIDRQEALDGDKAELSMAEALEDAPADGESRPVPRLGEYLLNYSFITPEQLKAALRAQTASARAGTPRRLGDILMEQGAITEDRLEFALKEQNRTFYSLFND